MSLSDHLKKQYHSKYTLSPRLIDLNRHSKVRDEVVSVFISAMMGHIVKSWEAVPCIGKKLLQSPSWMEAPKPAEHDESDTAAKAMDEQKRSSSEGEKQRSSLLEQLKEGKKVNQKSKISDDASFKESVNNFRSSSDSMKSSSYLTEWTSVTNDPTVLTEDWRFYEGDQIAIIEFKNGNKYRGRLSRNVMHGEGEFFWANGTVYQGTFYCGEIIGKGVIRWPDLSWYEGDVYYGYRHGNGLLVIHTFLSYSGGWIQGIRHGQGMLVYYGASSESCYDVTWNRGVCAGYGLHVYSSGSQYDGQWKHGRRHGYGVMIWSNGDVYLGDWVDGKMDGIGKYIWYGYMTDEFVIPARNSYYGSWTSNTKDGVGILETISGVCIKGVWRHDRKDGYGEIICRNGIQIEKSPLFLNDHLVELHFDEKHPWSFMMKLDNINITKHHAGYNIEKNGGEKCVKRNKTNEDHTNKDTMISENETIFYLRESLDSKTHANIKFNPTTLPSEYIDLLYYLTRLKNKLSSKPNLHRFEKKIYNQKLFDEFNAPQLKIRIQRRDNGTVNRSVEYDPLKLLQFYKFESKWVRNVILRHLPYLKKLYYDYASFFCSKPPNFDVILPRLLLWQMFHDIKIQEREVTLSFIDMHVKKNPASMIKDIKNPFEPIKFFQFVHYLTELSWHLYGKNNVGFNNTPGILASAFEKLIEDDIKPNARNYNGISLLIYQDLLPLADMYNNLYNKYSIDTTRKFLAFILNTKQKYNHFSQNEELNNEELYATIFGISDFEYRNIYDIGDRPNYKKIIQKPSVLLRIEKLLIPVNIEDIDSEKTTKEADEKDETETSELQPPETINENKNVNPHPKKSVINSFSANANTTKTSAIEKINEKENIFEDLENDINKYSLMNMDFLSAMECVQEVCPSIKTNRLIVNIDYKITFLEFYEMLILCALKSLQIDKTKKEIENQSKIIENNKEKLSSGLTSPAKSNSAKRKSLGKTKK